MPWFHHVISRFKSLQSIKVEKDPHCQSLLKKLYPHECLFGDIGHLIENADKLPKNKLADPRKLRIKTHAPCLTHGQNCIVPDLASMLGVLGAPCVLFSRFLNHELVV